MPVPLSDFLSEVLPAVPGCPEPIALNALRNAIAQICDRTLLWQETLDAEAVTATSFPYTMVAPTGAEVTRVMAVIIDGRPLGVVTMDALNRAGKTGTGDEGTPRAYFLTDPSTLGIYPLPEVEVDLVLRLAYRPARSATAVGDVVYREAAEIAAYGAKARLLEAPSAPWANPQYADFCARQFAAGITRLTVDANRTFGRTPMSVQMRRG